MFVCSCCFTGAVVVVVPEHPRLPRPSLAPPPPATAEPAPPVYTRPPPGQHLVHLQCERMIRHVLPLQVYTGPTAAGPAFESALPAGSLVIFTSGTIHGRNSFKVPHGNVHRDI